MNNIIPITIKEAFTTEPKFTKHIADNPDVATRLLDAVGMSMNDDYKIIAEDRTFDNKRVDLTINDSEGTTVAVIEAQDCTGWLDSVHASKIGYYCWDKECFEAIIITEDADEKIKDYVKWMNTHPDLNIYLVVTIVYKTDNGPFVDFKALQRPYSFKEKKQKITDTINNSKILGLEKLEQIHNDNPGVFDGVFTNDAGGYAVPGCKISIAPKDSGWNLGIWNSDNGQSDYRPKKINEDKVFITDEFKNIMNKLIEEHDLKSSISTQSKGFSAGGISFNFNNIDDALKYFKIFKEEIKNG